MAAHDGANAPREADVRAMLQFVADLSSFEHPEDFRGGALPGLRELVPSDTVTYNEVDFEAGTMVAGEDPVGSMIPDAPEIFVRLGHQNPLVTRYQRTRDGRPYKWSDFITRRQLHATELYHEAYRPMGVEYQLAFCLAAPAELIIGIAFNRGSRDFAERERRLLNLIRAPMIQAYRTVERYAALAAQLSALARGLERTGTGLIVLEQTPRGYAPSVISSQARHVLDPRAPDSGPLPEPVTRWIAGLPTADAKGSVAAEPGLVHASDGTAVTLRFLPARNAREADAVLVDPVAEPLSVASLRAAGLSARQAEVLRLVAFGQSDKAVAQALGVSARTVQKHLQNIYDLLGATSRTQAVRTAWSIDRGIPVEDAEPSDPAT